MTRLWIGIGFLVALLALGITVPIAMDQVAEPVSAQLSQAQQLALAGQLPAATALAQQADEDWHAHWKLIATVADHTPMEEIDRMFAELQAFGQAEETAEFAATSAGLARLTQAMAEAHRFSWWNLA